MKKFIFKSEKNRQLQIREDFARILVELLDNHIGHTKKYDSAFIQKGYPVDLIKRKYKTKKKATSYLCRSEDNSDFDECLMELIDNMENEKYFYLAAYFFNNEKIYFLKKIKAGKLENLVSPYEI